MRDIDVFSKLLNLQAPWKVDRISLVPKQHRLDVWLAHRRGSQFANALDQHSVVTKAGAHVGQDATLPVLVTEPNMVAVRMYPDETARLFVLSEPAADWAG